MKTFFSQIHKKMSEKICVLNYKKHAVYFRALLYISTEVDVVKFQKFYFSRNFREERCQKFKIYIIAMIYENICFVNNSNEKCTIKI